MKRRSQLVSDGDNSENDFLNELISENDNEIEQDEYDKYNDNEYDNNDQDIDYVCDYNVNEIDYDSFLNDSEEFTSFISSGYGTRPSSTISLNNTEINDKETNQTNDIINSLNLNIPELEPILSNSPKRSNNIGKNRQPVAKMTDLGFKMSKMIMSSSRKSRESEAEFFDEDNAMSGDSLVDNYGQTKKKQKTGKRGRPKGTTKVGTQFGRASSTHALPPNVSALMGQANVAYVQKQYPRAIELYLQVVQRAPASPEPYYSLGLVYEEENNADKAASYFLIAAHLQPRADGELWRRIAALLVQVVPSRKDQAIYCLTRAIKAPKPADFQIQDDFPLYWLRAKLQLEMGQYRSVITGFGTALKAHLFQDAEDLTPLVLVAKLSVRMSLAYMATSLLENVYRSAVTSNLPLNWSHLNILIELAEVDEDHAAILEAIEEFSVACYLQSGREQGQTNWMLKTPQEQLHRALESEEMPPELKLKMKIAQIHLNRACTPETLISLLKQIEKPGSKLKLSTADALLVANAPIPALQLMLEVIEEDGTMATPELCLKIGSTYRKAGELEMAVESFLAVLQVEPDHRATRLALSEAYRSLGKVEQALQVLPSEISISNNQDELKNNFINWEALDELFVKAVGVGIDINNLNDDENAEDDEDSGESRSEIFSMDTFDDESHTKQKLRFGPERQKRLNRFKKLPIQEYSESQEVAFRENYDKLMNLNDLKAGGIILQDFSDNAGYFSADIFRKREKEKGSVVFTIHGLEIEEWSQALLQAISLQARDCFRRNLSKNEWDRLIRILKNILSSNLRVEDHLIKWRVMGVLLAEKAERWDFLIENVKYLISNNCIGGFVLSSRYLHVSKEFLAAFYHPITFRSLARLNNRSQQSNPALLVLLGHQSLETHNYDEAARMYLKAAKLKPEWRFVYLCVGNALMGRTFQRTCGNQLARLTQALAYFMKYWQQGNGQCEYNLARAFHQAGMNHLAINFYRNCIEVDGGIFKHLAKYNLSRLYLHCGVPEMARHFLRS